MVSNITWLGHASFKIVDRVTDKVIYCDPWKLKHIDKPDDKADLILVSHPHFDHFSPEDIHKILKPETVIVSVKEVADKFPKNSRVLMSGNKLTVFGIEIEAIPAYNPAKQFHPRQNNWNGYIFCANNLLIYHAGDTDATPEMLALKNIDVALLPIGGTYTMSAEEAANAANTFKPKLALPMHYGDIVGKWEDGVTFKNKCEIDVELSRPE
ncbi:TPA: MBL fold metallo-hydrolase [Candidatus Woesearchaeota archaeon]|nr:MBL fold metallo-hydrolase [Candidatus Woesearchaeota archaeon]